MAESLAQALAALLALALLWLAWWLLVASEGVYLGQRAVIWLYDRFATRYDAAKGFEPLYEQALLAQPLLDEIAPLRSPMVLDVATGSGRLPVALLEHPDFQGRVIACDLSRGMLGIAGRKLRDQAQRCLLLRCTAQDLPFEDGSFDAVTCFEALEFMTRPGSALAELLRVLRPGGLLFISNRINTRLMPGKTWQEERLARLLRRHGAETMRREPWQIDYERVFARKAGNSDPLGARAFFELLPCPCCGERALSVTGAGQVKCSRCPALAPIDAAGYLDWEAWRSRC